MVRNSFFIFFICSFFQLFSQENKLNLLVGTYTDKCDSNGIYIYEFDTQTGDFSVKTNTDQIKNPSYLTISDDRKKIYSVNESGDQSSVTSFDFDPVTGNIKLINQVNSQGNDPCYIINDDQNVLVANYSGGNITVFKKQTDGSLTEAVQVIKHKGSSIDPERQTAPHVHMVRFSPDKKYVFATDLGTDFIYQYHYDSDAANEILKIKDSIAVKKGSGPRHLTFTPNGKFAYLLNEMTGSLIVYGFQNETLRKIEEAQIIDDTFHGEVSAADIHVSPDGKFLYATNRAKANDITIFEILSNGKLMFRNFMKTGGKSPRNFAIDPTGRFVLIANQNSNEIIIFRRDEKTGRLVNTRKKINICQPVCLVFSEI